MKNVEVMNQEELENALKNPDVWPILRGDEHFEIYGSSQVTAYGSSQVTAYGSSQVRAYGSSQVTAYGSSQVTAYDSSQVRAYGSSQVRAYDSSQVTAYGSSQVTAYDSSQVTAYDSSQVRAYGSSQVMAYGSSQVRASKYVAVTKHRNNASVTGGVQIDYHEPDTIAEWLENYGIDTIGGIAILYKAVDSDFKSKKGGIYSPGSTPKSDSWDTKECGHGLHFSPTPSHALAFNSSAKKFVGCPVLVDSLLNFPQGDYPEKVKSAQVVEPGCFEVDINGNKI